MKGSRLENLGGWARVVSSTGLSRSVSEDELPDLGPVEFLAKPFTRRALGEAVRRALDLRGDPVQNQGGEDQN